MKRSMMFYLTLPLAMAGCNPEPPSGNTTGEDETEGITTLDTVGDGDGDNGDGDGDNGDGDGEGDGDGAPMDAPDCGEVMITPTYIPPNVMLVVDASGSMVYEPNNWDHDLDGNTPLVTRWFSLHGVVDTVMSNYGPAMNSGLQRFPSAAACDPSPCYNVTSCTTETSPEVEMALDNGAAVLAALPGPNADSTEIEGGTPATKGMVSAINHLLTLPEELPRYVVLITDGAANCNTDLPFPDYIEFYDETLPTTKTSRPSSSGSTSSTCCWAPAPMVRPRPTPTSASMTLHSPVVRQRTAAMTLRSSSTPPTKPSCWTPSKRSSAPSPSARSI
jgi:hypothetical protein